MKAAVAMFLNVSVPSVKILSNVVSEKLLPIKRSVTSLPIVFSEKLLSITLSVTPLSNVLSEKNYCPLCAV